MAPQPEPRTDGPARSGGGEHVEEQPQPYEILILVCTNRREEGKAACANRGSEALKDALKSALKDRGLKGRVRVSSSGCLGRCELGPNVMVFPDGIWFSGVGEEDLPDLIERYLERGPALPETEF